MIHALHGNFGSPSDWEPALPSGIAKRCWDLWEIRHRCPEARSLAGFARWLNRQAASAPAPLLPEPQPTVADSGCSFAGHPNRDMGSQPFSDLRQPNILAAYSLGGRLALSALATAPPGLWQAAVLLAPHPGLSDPADRAARLSHDQGWAQRCRRESWQELLAAWNAQPLLNGGDFPSADTSWQSEIAGAFEDWSLGQQPDFLPFLSRNRILILWITGAKDTKFTALAAQAAQISPSITHHILPHCGHRLLQQAPGQIQELIRQFLPQIHKPGPLEPQS